jgi:hypothetical protein
VESDYLIRRSVNDKTLNEAEPRSQGQISPPHYELALFGQSASEVSGAGYHRIKVSRSYFQWDGNIMSNIMDISFPESQSHWGTICSLLITDLSKEYDPVMGHFHYKETVQKGITVAFVHGDISVRWVK